MSVAVPDAPFPGFSPEAFAFLRALRANNDRTWFKARKATFDDELMTPLRLLVRDVAEACVAVDLPLRADANKSVFRVYRDVRFSKDTTPYNTHVAATWTRTGARNAPGGLYVHVAPDNCFLAAGFWSPPTPLLHRLRAAMAADGPAYLSIADALTRGGFELQAHQTLKRMPRGYEDFKGTALEARLRRKGVIAMRPVEDQATMTPAFKDTVLRVAETTRSLLEFGWAAEDAAP